MIRLRVLGAQEPLQEEGPNSEEWPRSGPLIIVGVPAIIVTMFIDEYIPVSTAKSQFLNLLRRIEEQHAKVVITKSGAPKAVLLPYRDFEGLCETIDILAEPAMVQGIRRGLDNVTAGRVVSVEEAFED